MQSTTQEFETLNAGKSNEKSPARVAEEWMARQILLQKRKGLVEVNDQGHYEEKATDIDFGSPLPTHVRFWKPKNSLSAGLKKKLANKSALAVRKRNGNMFSVVIHEDGEPRMYSSTSMGSPKGEPGMSWIDRFPELGSAIKSLNIPAGTILLGEVVAGEETDDLNYVGKVLRALTSQAIGTQQAHGHLHFVVWDIAAYRGKMIGGTTSYMYRRDLVSTILRSQRSIVHQPEIIDLNDMEDPINDLMSMAIENGWEGFVIIDPSSAFGDAAVSYSGKPDRPKQAGKLKPKYENDFIIRWDPDNGVGQRGKGKKSVGVGSVNAYLLDENGQEVFISKVGGGLSMEDVVKYADPSIYPLVWEVSFISLTPGGSLEFPEFVRERYDKPYEDCTLDTMDELRLVRV